MDVGIGGQYNRSRFWLARLAQAVLILLIIVQLLSPFFSLVYLTISGWGKTLGLGYSAIFLAGLQFYPRSFFIGLLIALIWALRSASWGSLSWRFCLISALVAAFMAETFLRMLTAARFFIDFQFFSVDYSLSIVAYIVTAFILRAIIGWTGLHRRYRVGERRRLYDALFAAIFLGLVGPFLCVLWIQYWYWNEETVIAYARGEIVSVRSDIFIVFFTCISLAVIRRLRHDGKMSLSFLLVIMLLVFNFYYCFVWLVGTSGFSFGYVGIYNAFIFVFTLIAGGFLYLGGIPYIKTHYQSILVPKITFHNASRFWFAGFILVVSVIITTPLCLWGEVYFQTIFFGLPGQSVVLYLLPQVLWQALFFAVFCALYAMLHGALDYRGMCYMALLSTLFGCIFLPWPLFEGLGNLHEIIIRPFVTYLIAAAIDWYILSLCRQVDKQNIPDYASDAVCDHNHCGYRE